jgi:hypothetical protein
MSTPATLSQSIHARWSASTALCALVPSARFCTGRVPASEEMPYVRLELQGGTEMLRSHETLYEKRPIVFHVWTDTFDSGDAVAAAIRAAFAHAAFDWGTGGVLDCRPLGGPAARQIARAEFKAWETIVRFQAMTWEQRTDA